jgi:hypothetical protein
MYGVDRHDRIEALTDLPQQSAGAPVPLVIADDSELLLAYRLAPLAEEVAIVEFDMPLAHYSGPPNDEAIQGHPLYPKGLKPYSAYEVCASSWIRGLERMNRIHPHHSPAMFSRCRHFVFTFHDTTFECIANGIRKVTRMPYADHEGLLGEMRRRLPEQRVSRVSSP